MSHRVPSAALALGLALWMAPPAWAAKPAKLLDRASACQRRAKPACTLDYADRALKQLDEAGDAALRREALRMRARALALLDRAEEAQAAFDVVLTDTPIWRPAPEADPRVRAAVEAVRRARLLATLPTTLEPLPWPVPEGPDLLPPLTLYRPAPTAAGAQPQEPGRWTVSLGGGIAIPLPDSDHLYAPGPAALVEVTYRLVDRLSLWTQLMVSLMAFQDEVPVEPGYGRGLTIVSGAVGVAYTIEIIAWMDAHFAGGLGLGGFGVHDPVEAFGITLDTSMGLRFRFDNHLAVRVDVLPTMVFPTNGVGAGGHISTVVRGELRF